MALHYSCDGCGSAVETPKKVGHVVKRDYCEECEKKARAFLDAEEAERLAIATVFQGKREKLIAQYGANNFKLPDVP